MSDSTPTTAAGPTPCVGWLGRIFGHKFTKVAYDGPFPTCLRCGMPRFGGWPK